MLKIFNFNNINQKISKSIIVLLVLYGAYVGAGLVWLFYTQNYQTTADTAITSYKKTNDTNRLPVNLFGKEPREVKKNNDFSEIKRTPLNLKLIGVLFKENISLALISENDKPAKIYKIKDSINQSTKIQSIEGNFVILERYGKSEKLGINFSTIKDRKKAKSKEKLPSSFVAKLSSSQKNTLNKYRKQINTNPKNLLSVVSVTPVFDNGELQGMRVEPGKRHGLFKSLGFEKNDLITEVNQIPIDSMTKLGRIKKVLSEDSKIEITLYRKNDLHYLSIQL